MSEFARDDMGGAVQQSVRVQLDELRKRYGDRAPPGPWA